MLGPHNHTDIHDLNFFQGMEVYLMADVIDLAKTKYIIFLVEMKPISVLATTSLKLAVMTLF